MQKFIPMIPPSEKFLHSYPSEPREYHAQNLRRWLLLNFHCTCPWNTCPSPYQVIIIHHFFFLSSLPSTNFLPAFFIHLSAKPTICQINGGQIITFSFELHGKYTFLNPQHPNINMHILLDVLYTFLKVLTRRICSMIKSFLSWWSSPLFSRPQCVIQG